MYKVLDLSDVSTGTTIKDLTAADKKRLKKEMVYYEFKTDKKLIEFAEELAAVIGDEEEFSTAEEAEEYLDMMGYSVQ